MVWKGRFFTVLVVFLLAVCSGWVLAGTYSGGTGEPNDPYRIATAEDMQAIGANPNDWDKHFILVNDIDLGGYTGKQFNIIGHYRVEDPNNKAFTGVFDGSGFAISNFTYEYDRSGGVGLFGYVDDANAQIKDLTLINPNIQAASADDVGGLIGSMENGKVVGCSIEGGRVLGDYCVGGLVGWNHYGIISACCASAEVIGFSSGGLVGANGRGGRISACYATGSVSFNGYASAGGLVGINGGMISACHATGEVSGYNEVGAVGGLVGENPGEISNCYATGPTWAYRSVGGLAGYNTGVISGCYAAGLVAGSHHVGGFVGWDGGGWYSACFWDRDVNPTLWGFGYRGEGSDVTGGSTQALQSRGTFTDAGWDFIEIWNIGEKQTYPFLRQYPAGDINHDRRVDFPDLAILASHWLEYTGPQ